MTTHLSPARGTAPRGGLRLAIAATIAAGLAAALVGATAAPASAAPTIYRLLDDYPVGAAPVAVAIDTSAHLAWVVNRGGSTVTAIDTHTHTTAVTLAVGPDPESIAINRDSGTVYVGSHGDGTVSVIDETTLTVTGTLATSSTGVNALAVDTVAQTLYVADEQGEDVLRIDLATGMQSPHGIHVGRFPTALSLDPVHHRLYVVNGASDAGTAGDDSVVIVSTTTGHSLGTITPVGSAPASIVVDPATQLAFVGRSGSSGVAVIDGVARARAKPVLFPFKVTGVALDAAAKKIIAVGGNRVAVIDSRTRALVYRSQLETPDLGVVDADVTAVAVNGASHELYLPDRSAADTASTVGVYARILSPTITNGAPPSGRVGHHYSFRFRAASDPAASFFASPGLPPGLELATTGVLSGTPTRAGTFSFTVIASNPASTEATKRFSIVIRR